MGSRGLRENFPQGIDQEAAVMAHGPEFTPCLKRLPSLSMFISLETRHLVLGLELIIFHFSFFCWLAWFIFFTKHCQKKLTPSSLIVLLNAAGLHFGTTEKVTKFSLT